MQNYSMLEGSMLERAVLFLRMMFERIEMEGFDAPELVSRQASILED